MKRTTLFIFCFAHFISNAQNYEIIDSAQLECVYSYDFQQDSLSRESMASEEMILQVGSKYSKFTSVTELYLDSLFILYQDEPVEVGFAKIRPLTQSIRIGRLCNYVVFKNYPQSGATVFVSFLDGTHFKVEESEPINWKISTDRDTVLLSYACQMAKTNFAGREYEAWFTGDVPVSDGPYKFRGLPGLIVQIADKEGQHKFKLISVKKCSKKKPIFYYSKDNCTTIKPSGYIKALTNYSNEIVTMIQNGAINFFNDEGKAEALHRAKSKNNFIERY